MVILFLGDVVGEPGRCALYKALPELRAEYGVDAVIVNGENAAVVGHIYAVIARLAKELGFADGYRVVTNVGELAGQTVHHIHVHVLAGAQMNDGNPSK